MSLAEKLKDFVGYETYDDEYDPVPADRSSRRRTRSEPEPPAQPVLQIVLLKLENADDARNAVQQLAQGQAVVFSLAGTPRALSRRLLDFVCGGLYVHEGWVEHIAVDTYLLLPPGIEILYE